MSNLLVTINLVVLNGEKYIRHCLNSIKTQTYPHNQTEINILDNGSTDATKTIIKELAGEFSDFLKFNLVENYKNLGMWPGHEELLKHSSGKYVLCVSVDVMIDERFAEKAVTICESDPEIDAVQAKIYQYNHNELTDGSYEKNTVVDTCGFAITRERKVVNIGHGKLDGPAFSKQRIVFGVEGAVPFFRRTALENCKINGWIWDPDYFWYGDDLDLAWRMTLFGHKQVYSPEVIAWHDRSTTKGNVTTDFLANYVQRRKIRQKIPIHKRRLDWSNTRFTIIKNDYLRNILRDLPAIIMREINVQGYAGLFEQRMLLEWGRFLHFLPRMIARRHTIMKRARMSVNDIHSLMLINIHEENPAPASEIRWRILQIIVISIVIFFVIILALQLSKIIIQ
jgi:GT2 family glycosyltransferase